MGFDDGLLRLEAGFLGFGAGFLGLGAGFFGLGDGFFGLGEGFFGFGFGFGEGVGMGVGVGPPDWPRAGGGSGVWVKSKQSAMSSEAASRWLIGAIPNVVSQNFTRLTCEWKTLEM